MSGIGPQLPPHLQKQLGISSAADDSDSDSDVGPALPPSVGPQLPPGFGSSRRRDEDDEAVGTGGVVGPTIPARILKKSTPANSRSPPAASPPRVAAGPSRPSPPEASQASTSTNKRVMGPSFPTYGPTYNAQTYSQMQGMDEDDSDDDVGPKPLPAGMKHQESSAVQEFMEREERRRKQLEEANKPKAPKREEWMLVPPSHSDLLGKLDPTKLKKGRQFSKNTNERSNDTSLWTETPQERQKRLEDEVSGKKRRATDTAPVDDDPDKKRRRQEEARIRQGVDEYTKNKRGGALVDQHATALAGQKESDEPPVIWDHARDMGLGGRLMDDGKRNKLLQEAKGLGSRFSTGKSGGFM